MKPCARIFSVAAWPGEANFKSWVSNPPRKKWPDFLKHDEINGIKVISGRVVADLLEAGLADGEFVPLAIKDAPLQYFAIRARAKIQVREESISAKCGYNEPVFSNVPDYEGYKGHAFVGGVRQKNGEGLLCIPAILDLAKSKKWTGVDIHGFADGRDLYTCNDQGKVTDENPEPPASIVDGYYVPQDVIAADLIRARELAAELQSSPDTPEWTRRSFEIVRKALAEAPHTLGYPLPESAKPRRVSRPDAPLIDPKVLKRLKLAGDDELEGEIELGRPLFGADTLSVIVSDAVVDDEAPEVSFSKSEMALRAKAALEKLESRLPAIDAAIDQQAAAHEKSPTDFRATLHDPGLFLCTADMAEGDRWTFIVKDELVAHHFEFDGDTLTEVWSAD